MNRRTLISLLLLPCIEGQITVALEPSTPPPARVGQVITWTATAGGAGSTPLWYRFRARRAGQAFRVIQDYGPANAFEWSASEHEGQYQIEVSACDPATGKSASAKAQYEVRSNVTGRAPAIESTSNPLVFLYSAPACAAESRMRVRFEAPGQAPQFTPYKRCERGLSMNFYLAGLHPRTRYIAWHIVDTGSAFHEGPSVTFATGVPEIAPPAQTVLDPVPSARGILLQGTQKNIVATDLNGSLLWYYARPIMLLTRPDRGGFFWGIAGSSIVRFDLVGTTALSTTVARVNQQLAAMGKPLITGFHHEVRSLPDGSVLALASTERILTDVQGPGAVDIAGDAIVVMDRDFQVTWTWDAFDHLDVTRKAVLGETCAACAHLAKTANDWTHSNSVSMTPDGNLLLSSRNQDMVYKITFENGAGDGHVIWRLGNGGDFRLSSNDAYPWFSHQHDAEYSYDGESICLFDDGNTRRAFDPAAHSRGQAIRIDEKTMTADLVLNADLGVYSSALGSAQKLPDGDYFFESGFLPDSTSMAAEVDPYGHLIYQMHTGSQQYRAFLMRDLYTPAN